MTMTPEEIAADYRQAKTPQKQITILAELNCISRDEIKKILIEQGCTLPRNMQKKPKAEKPAEKKPKVEKPVEKKPYKVTLSMKECEVLEEFIETHLPAAVISYDKIETLVHLHDRLEEACQCDESPFVSRLSYC